MLRLPCLFGVACLLLVLAHCSETGTATPTTRDEGPSPALLPTSPLSSRRPNPADLAGNERVIGPSGPFDEGLPITSIEPSSPVLPESPLGDAGLDPSADAGADAAVDAATAQQTARSAP